MSKIVCSVCGSSDVQAKVWVRLNENCETTTDFIDEMIREPADCWCCNCEENQKLIIVNEEENEPSQNHICPACQEGALRYAMIDVDGTNLEEGYYCQECGEKFLGLNNEEVKQSNKNYV